MISYQRDAQTGIERQINKGGYMPAPHLPGATMIPSNSGSYGGQEGVDLDDPLPVVINPGESNEIHLTSLDMKSELMKRCAKENRGDVQKTYATYVKLKGTAMGKKNDLGIPMGPVTVEQPTKNSNAIGKSKVRPVKAEPVVESNVEQPVEHKTAIPENELLSVIQSMLKGMIDVQREQVITPVVSPTVPQFTKACDTLNGMPIPKVRVTFKDSRGGTWESSYHHVSMQGDKIVLVYDLAFTFGSKINPPVDMDVPYELTIIPGKSEDGTPQQPVTKWVLNMGIDHVFTYEDKQWSFQILHVTEKPQVRPEAEPEGMQLN